MRPTAGEDDFRLMRVAASTDIVERADPELVSWRVGTPL